MRRSRGEGSITERKKEKRWQVAVHLGYRDGRRVRRYLYAATKAEAKQLLAEALRTQQQVGWVPSVGLTVSAWLDQWLRDALPALRPATQRSYRMIVAQHLSPSLGRIRLAKLSAHDVQGYLTEAQTKVSARTVQYHHAVLRRALGQAERLNLVTRNVAKLATGPRVTRTEVTPLTAEQVKRLLEVTGGHSLERSGAGSGHHGRPDGLQPPDVGLPHRTSERIQGGHADRLHALYVLAVNTGLRQGELLGLAWEDVDLERRRLTVRLALQRIDGVPTLVEPKTQKSRRTIDLPEDVIPVLREHRKRQLAERLAAGPKWGERGFVFASPTGEPLEGTNVTREFQRALARAGLPRQTFHSLRHSYATIALQAGVPMRVVQEVLGHSSMAMTANVYSHVVPELSADAAQRVGDALRRAR